MTHSPIEPLSNLQQAVERVRQSSFYTLFPQEMSQQDRALLMAAPAAVAYCLSQNQIWNTPPKQIHLLLLNPGQLDAVDDGYAWGVLPSLLGLSSLTPIHLTIVGQSIELASSAGNCHELRSIQVDLHRQPPIEFLLEHPEYRADAAFLMHPSTELSLSGSHTLRELQQRNIPLFGASFSQQDAEQLSRHLIEQEIAQFEWHMPNPCALPLNPYMDSDTIWAHTLWKVDTTPLASSADQRIGDLTRQTVLNIIEGGEAVTQQFLTDLRTERSALTTILNLLALLDPQSRSELNAYLFWNLFSQIRQGGVNEQQDELLRLMANLGWLGAAEEREGG